jgi:thioredoxin-like negative regulator of GroEL
VPPLLAGGLAALARVLLARGKVAEALARAEEAHVLFQQLGNLEEGEASVRLAYGQCLLAAGDRDRAREVLAAAARRLEARAALIDEPQWREAFLARIPDHAQTLALHRA